MRSLTSALLVLALTACSTAFQRPGSAATEASVDPASEARPVEKKTCRDMSTTGSYGSRYVCHTKAEWEKIDALS